ncbi:MAG: DUF3018 family protein [Pseudomonadota bacterium]|nr:DUF3018 family protein [Pseudomonadota bacterium]MDP1906255.1 DUF3018 family protein [Pseudomonadota bacterium]MDP2353801.1 DUF3018 family protein [Pseudomonadota bacterium]
MWFAALTTSYAGWVPDTRGPDFAEECQRQSRLAAESDRTDTEIERFMDAALTNVDGRTE